MNNHPLVAVVMGSRSDWETMQATTTLLKQLTIPYHVQVISAHRTPDLLQDFAKTAMEKGFKCIIAGAGGAAHLPGMLAAHTALPVIGVPIQSRALNGLDSLLSIVQMPAGIPVATVAIGEAGAKNAALLAAAMLANEDAKIRDQLQQYRQQQTQTVLDNLKLEG
jgi:5-(carboxyamino)imidazole ribonucleotide mutase